MGVKRAEIGVFGGSGFYRFAAQVEEIEVNTPFGKPSEAMALATIGGRKVAFLPRHGREHTIPPHQINYRANLWAMKELGVTRLISPCAAGSLQPQVRPGDFVLCDQFVDRTSGRKDTFYDGPVTTHISTADPYCPELRALAAASVQGLGINLHTTGTVVVIQGPRFSTRSESRWFSRQGWEVINMTQYPEVVLALELGMCFLNISLITDYDVGLAGCAEAVPVTHGEVLRVFQANNEKLKGWLESLIHHLPPVRGCRCAAVLEEAR